MFRSTFALTLSALGALGLLRGPGCGETSEPTGGLNAPCTRTSDCTDDLDCRKGVCTDGKTPVPDSGSSTGAGDAGLSEAEAGKDGGGD